MDERRSGLSLFLHSYANLFIALKNNKRILAPFIIFAVLEAASLIFLYLAPREPLKNMMGPIISNLWGERFLHYPQNFLLLPKLAFRARMALSIFLGSLLTGCSIALLYKRSVTYAFRKYAHLFAVVFLFTALYYSLNKLFYSFLVNYFTSGHQELIFLGPGQWLGPINIFVGQMTALCFQSAFIFAIPAIILSEKKFMGAIGESFVFFSKHFVVTLLLVGLPMVMVIPLIFLNYNTGFLIEHLFPESVLWVGFLSIILNSLLLDPVVTLTAAAFYVEKREK